MILASFNDIIPVTSFMSAPTPLPFRYEVQFWVHSIHHSNITEIHLNFFHCLNTYSQVQRFEGHYLLFQQCTFETSYMWININGKSSNVFQWCVQCSTGKNFHATSPFHCWYCGFESCWGYGCYISCVFCRYRTLWRADHSSRGFLPSVCTSSCD